METIETHRLMKKTSEIRKIAFLGDCVSNVVYACGKLLHGRELIIPYAMSDHATGFASVSLDAVLSAME